MSPIAHRIATHQHALLACRALRTAPLHTLLHECGDGQDAEDIDWPRCASAGHALLPDHTLAQRLLAGLHEAWRLGLLQRTLVPVPGDPAAYRVMWQRRSVATQSAQPPVMPGALPVSLQAAAQHPAA